MEKGFETIRALAGRVEIVALERRRKPACRADESAADLGRLRWQWSPRDCDVVHLLR